MKTRFITLFLLLYVAKSFAQNIPRAPIQINSIDSTVVYKLFPTQNAFTFIKLNTRNGQMWQVESNKSNKNKAVTTLSAISLANKDEERNGRFVLYQTFNIFDFILLDQIDGRMWQITWGREKDRKVLLIE
ncbi:MAG: hypothetical protein LBV59_02870 [Sphingobacterium sp.]|jgi:hypothetical protein|uniref:hypothetical protein n=1 Tax=Sphingobacterium sp. TaxID=341027 RepID=UPI00283EF697|nr:hypothetical protein [Sphingobacterium sp.]MDR3006847.1 hypothetical protein [Sphingobacterium sp.]